MVEIRNDDTGRSARLARSEARAATPTERDLLLRFRDGDTGAFDELVQRYRAPVFSYLVRCGVAEADRDDLFQEVFVRLHRSVHQYRSERPLHPWLFTIVANTVRTFLRRQRVRQLLFVEPGERDAPSPLPDGEQLSNARETRAFLERSIGSLPLAQREVLILTCIEHLPQREAAKILGIPVNTVKTHLRRARLTLVRELARRDGRPGGEDPS
jgi:RNA polymerase sigma-70 factor (ECF subfamily)